jgi:LacI family transcriptional regulator
MNTPRPRRKKRVTITDVALEAGVSIAAVSRILNNSYDGFSAREETKQRVYDAVRKLGYRPSSSAITLATGRRNALALCYAPHDIEGTPVERGSLEQVFRNYETMLVITGVRRALAGKNLDLILIAPPSQYNTRDEFIFHVQDKVDGVVWINPEDEGETITEMVRQGIPLAVVGSAPVTGDFINLRADEETAGRMAAGQLIVRGARNILVAMPKERQNEVGIKERLEGARKAARDYQGGEVKLTVLRLSLEGGEAQKAFAEHLDKKGLPDGILSLGGHLPFSILRELDARQLEVPHDTLLVGFEENPLYQVNLPTLTGVRYPTEQMCTEAVRMLLEMISGAAMAQPIYMKPRLIARQSCP